MIEQKPDRNLRLVEIIEKNPGIQFRQIMRFTGMKNGVLSHYLGKLEKNGTVNVERGSRQTRFYPPKITKEESNIIKALRRQTPRDIMLALIKNGDEGLAFGEIVKEVRKSPSTVSLYLSQLVEDDVVYKKFVNSKKIYQIKDRYIVDKLIEDYRPGILERPSDSFGDIINSL